MPILLSAVLHCPLILINADPMGDDAVVA